MVTQSQCEHFLVGVKFQTQEYDDNLNACLFIDTQIMRAPRKAANEGCRELNYLLTIL
jgi:hypothetical protein